MDKEKKHNYTITSNPKKLKSASNFFKKNGFCVIENVIPKSKIETIKYEALNARINYSANLNRYKELLKKNLNDEQLLRHKKLQVRKHRIIGKHPKIVNEIVWMPNYARYLSSNFISSFVKEILGEHIKIAHLHTKKAPQINTIKKRIKISNDPFGLPRLINGNKKAREWHTDWPHDPWAYGGGVKGENIGCLKQPFPDITMCLVMIWYLTDVDENTGGTFCIPKSHKFKKTPRGAEDNISTVSPMLDEIQIKAKAGSVLIQDSRLWHSASCQLDNKKGERVAVVNRWTPWWLAINDYAPDNRFNIVCNPINKSEYKKLPKKTKPFMRHLCADLKEYIHPKMVNRSLKSVKNQKKFYKKVDPKYK